MTISQFFGKFKSLSLWGNLFAMAVTVVLLALGVRFGLDLYTHHGESITVPNIVHRSYDVAEETLDHLGLKMEVVDTGYVKKLPPGCILQQSPDPGEHVKSGHIIYVTINATESPTIKIPDVIDNSSLREAMARLTAMGFKLGPPQFIAGEKDWVYGILVNGKHVVFGDRVAVDDKLIIQVGNGMRSADDSVNYIDPVFETEEDMGEGDVDNFEEVTAPPSEPADPGTVPSTEGKAEPQKESSGEVPAQK